MARTLKRSNLHFELALERLPLGVASDRGYWGDDRTFYVKRASGARLWDIDDNEYIDYRLGGGQAILGYADSRVSKAARAGISLGGAFALSTELEFAVAERIATMVPAAELVRFSNSEAEAVVDALRLARNFTGRDAIAVVEGRSHGLLGAVVWEAVGRERPLGAHPAPGSGAVRSSSDRLIYEVPINDIDRLDELLRSHGDQIGAFLIEPIPPHRLSMAADAAYLAEARALCDRFGVLLIIDEATTGFRVAKGGAQEFLGVRADLCTFGPSIASGYPIAALAGREEIMRRIGAGVVQGGSQIPHPVSLAVADKTLEILDRTDALEQIAKFGWRMREGMSQALSRRGIPHVFVGPPSMSMLRCGESGSPEDPEREKFKAVFCEYLAAHLHEFGILCEADFGGPWFISTAHNELCLAETLAKFERAVQGTLERLPDMPRRTASGTRQPPSSFANPS
ncbi:MAG: aminotransferase class III-fold pyridoxal phosphate-dependent enzyme [Deltaproteobacteria bacterium]|jgi:glutamate-1-semialdehyde 2,1-aminomutase|nr:aminotransferase class III-fold pyridoxal phosphate-dependent enzyme [Deltaproteobacteria bacterium]